MKRTIALMTAIIMSTISFNNVFAKNETEAYNHLMDVITETEPISKDYNYYVASDKFGNDWHGIFDNKGDIIALATTVYDRGVAEEIADDYGNKLYYKVPMEFRKGNDFYQVIVPVYENTEIEVLCARPLNLYEDGYKVIKDWDLNADGDVLILRTNLTPSYAVRITNGNDVGYIKWSDKWYPEEGNEVWNENMEIPEL